MSKALSEELKDVHIKLLLEDIILLEQKLNDIPEELKGSLAQLRHSVEQLPDQLSASLEKLAAGVEEAEKSYEEIAIKHQAIINQQLDEAKINLRQRITAEVADSMRDANVQLNKLARKIEDVNKQASFTNNKSLLAVLVMGFVTFLSVAGMVFMSLKVFA
ncbi:hypothetical protein [Enterobacter hormaechei]|jgi:methyl-accepting chemotaxis protein|uniref:hypothetical protein n=1 Tax=Enterobacter hormaechei TaxID=158836 RepID=UPI00388E9F49